MTKGAQSQRVKAMTGEEFEKRLKQLMEEIVKGLLYYAAWVSLRFCDKDKVPWSLGDQNKIVDSFGRFLTPVASALNGMALMQFAKVFDKNPRTASLVILLDAAQGKPSLVPNRTPADLQALSKQLKQGQRIINKLTGVRNQRLAHAEANPRQISLIKKDFDALIEQTKAAFDCLSIGHTGSIVAWDSPVREVEQDAAELMRVLIDKVK